MIYIYMHAHCKCYWRRECHCSQQGHGFYILLKKKKKTIDFQSFFPELYCVQSAFECITSFYFTILHVWGAIFMCIYPPHACSSHRGWKRISNSMKILEMVVYHHAYMEIKPQSSGRAGGLCPYLLVSYLSRPCVYYFYLALNYNSKFAVYDYIIKLVELKVFKTLRSLL